MNKIFFIISIGFCMWMTACSTRKHAMFTHFYNLAEKDSALVELQSIKADSLRILIVSMSADKPSLWDLEVNKQNIEDNQGRYASLVARSYTEGNQWTFRGRASSRTWTDRLILAVSQDLDEYTNTSIHSIDTSKEIHPDQLSSIAQKNNVDLIIAIDSLLFSFNQYVLSANKQLNIEGHSKERIFYESDTRELSITSYNFWSLYWIDPANGILRKKMRILQTGKYQDRGDELMNSLDACIRQMSKEFVRLFR